MANGDKARRRVGLDHVSECARYARDRKKQTSTSLLGCTVRASQRSSINDDDGTLWQGRSLLNRFVVFPISIFASTNKLRVFRSGSINSIPTARHLRGCYQRKE